MLHLDTIILKTWFPTDIYTILEPKDSPIDKFPNGIRFVDR